MDIDSKCYEALSGAGLESLLRPLQGGGAFTDTINGHAKRLFIGIVRSHGEDLANRFDDKSRRILSEVKAQLRAAPKSHITAELDGLSDERIRVYVNSQGLNAQERAVLAERIMIKRQIVEAGVARLNELATRLRREDDARVAEERRVRRAEERRQDINERRNVPDGSVDEITGDEIKNNDILVDFNHHYERDKIYFKSGTIDKFDPPIDPYSRQPLSNINYYIANIVPALRGSGMFSDILNKDSSTLKQRYKLTNPSREEYDKFKERYTNTLYKAKQQLLALPKTRVGNRMKNISTEEMDGFVQREPISDLAKRELRQKLRDKRNIVSSALNSIVADIYDLVRKRDSYDERSLRYVTEGGPFV